MQATGRASPLLSSVQILDPLLEVPECAGKQAPEGGGFSYSFHIEQMKWFCGFFIAWEDKGSSWDSAVTREDKENVLI